MACALIKISSAACAVIGKFPVSNRQPNDPKGSCLTFARQPMYWALSRRRSIAGSIMASSLANNSHPAHLGVSRQSVLQRVKRGELDAVLVHRAKRLAHQGCYRSPRPLRTHLLNQRVLL